MVNLKGPLLLSPGMGMFLQATDHISEQSTVLQQDRLGSRYMVHRYFFYLDREGKMVSRGRTLQLLIAAGLGSSDQGSRL